MEKGQVLKLQLLYPVLVALLAVAATACTSRPGTTAVRTTNRPPNIILLLVDDMGFADVSCYDGTQVPTPNIDRLAAEGTKFTSYYSAAPICSPSRVGILTGMMPARWNITSFLETRQHNRRCEQADFLDPTAPSVARQLQAAGYATGHFGKWHMGGGRDVDNAPAITRYGFDAYASTYESPDPDPLLTSTNWIWARTDSIKRWQRTAYFVDKTLAFLKAHPGQPCFVNLWPDDVHTPWVPDESTLDQFPGGTEKPREFRLVLTELDRQVGRLLAGLKELGIDDNTLLVFTSDNGPLPNFEGSRAMPYRGSKLSLYEGGTRMPFIVRYPGHTPAGAVDAQSVLSALDLLPTFVALAGGPTRPQPQADGHNVDSVFLGHPVVRRTPLFWEYGRNQTSFRYPLGRDRSPNLAMRQGRWKLLVNDDGSDVQLYDLDANPTETINAATQQPAIADKMRRQLLSWRAALPKLPVQ